jgi:hypothetical protein
VVLRDGRVDIGEHPLDDVYGVVSGCGAGLVRYARTVSVSVSGGVGRRTAARACA